MKWKHKTKVKKVIVTAIKELAKNQNEIKTEETDFEFQLTKV